MNSTVYKVDGSPYSPLLLCKVSKTRALQGEADKKQPGLNRKNVGWGERKKKFNIRKMFWKGGRWLSS